MHRLDRISGPWHLMLEWSWSRGLETVAPTVVAAAVRKEIEGLAPGKHQNIPFGGDAVLRATLVSASKHRDSIVSVDIPIVATSPGVASMQEDIKAKTHRYRGLQAAGIPFIVAIGTGMRPCQGVDR